MALTTNDELLAARKHIIEVSRELHEVGLLVRTWGNISQRIDENSFLITPSGIKYEDLSPEMIVKVNINDLSYEGDVLPSSEKAVHAVCYKERPDVEFIFHTQQVYASCAGTLGFKKLLTYFDDTDMVIPVAPYALPGTAKLASNVAATVKKYPDSRGFIMANHGTICLGKDSKEAVFEAVKMEVGFNSHLEGDKIVYDLPDTPERVKRIHEEIYKKRPDVRFIIHNKSEAVMTVSRRASHMKPLLDDFAQLIGVGVRIPSNENGKDGNNFHNIKKHVNAVFALNDGAYCVGSTLDDAMAVAIVLDKGCIAYLSVLRNGEGHYLSLWECIKMNRHYRKSYSKLADTKR